MDAIAAGDALTGRDNRLERFLTRFANIAAAAPVAPEHDTRPADRKMYDAVVQGRQETALALLDELIASGLEPGRIVDDILIPAITDVGDRFERKEYFLPQLMQSAAAMQKAMEKLEPLLQSGGGHADGPVFVLATVKGDIHDIGKNIVALLLKNHNFRVIDLGKDVPAETVVETAIREKASLIGLSALMTTTMELCDHNQFLEASELLLAAGLKLYLIIPEESNQPDAELVAERFTPGGRMRDAILNGNDEFAVLLTTMLKLWAQLKYNAFEGEPRMIFLAIAILFQTLLERTRGDGGIPGRLK